MTGSATSNGELLAAFRQKANFMKSWKPSSTPSNRDRLELYAWHKQAVSGDAPSSMPNPMTAAEKAKYTAWKSKSGTDPIVAMRNYIQESERQVRVYGYTPLTTAQQQQQQLPSASQQQHLQQPSRGLAAIPLLCAAASEARGAYLRRMQNTTMQNAWWKRQEPLTATPGSIASLPEALLLWVAGLLEHIALSVNGTIAGQQVPPVVAAIVQSALWPLHNALLAVWMGLILIASMVSSTYELTRTTLLGSVRTGRTLTFIWNDDVVFAANSVGTLVESHQPVSARVVGLVMQPLPILVGVLRMMTEKELWMAVLFSTVTILTWWYWMLVLPWFYVVVMLGSAILLGNCFAIIELAGHI